MEHHPRPSNAFRVFAREEVDQSIVGRFERQVDEHADRLAVKTREHTLTYLELDRWANRVAHTILARRGAAPEPVGLLLQQGAPLVAAILGVLKSGKMYLPLAPEHPAARNLRTLEDAGASLVITDSKATAGAPDLRAASIATLHIDEVDGGSTTRPRLPLAGDTLAYIYYTSGSTGRPKGVFDTHRNVLHNIMRYTNSLHIAATDRLTLLQSAHFSGAVSSLFNALLNGAAVFPYDVRRDGAGSGIAEWLIREDITIYHSVPALFRSFLTGTLQFPAMRIIRLEGDAATRIDVELFKKHFSPHCLLVNGLGATETGLTRQFFMDTNAVITGSTVPIGYPTTDMRALVVDEALTEVPAGTAGEIVIRSRFLAAGYWKDPALTRTAFMDDPEDSDERMYRTGDLGMMREDGRLEYMGRKDRQLKVRGHRIDPVEVEDALLRIGTLREAVAATVADPSGNAQLVAYVVPANTPSPTVASIRGALAAALPEFLIPSRVVFLDALPLTDNGKVDRTRLPSLAAAGVTRSVDYLAPRTDLERRIADIWETVLGVRPIGVKDNFFDLGGDSLKAAAMCTAVARTHGTNPPLSLLVEAPTIEQFAERMMKGAGGPLPALVAIQKRGTRPPFYCVHAHHGNVLSFAALSRELGEDQPFYGLQSPAFVNGASPDASIGDMAARYIGELRTVQPHGPYSLGGFCLGGVVAFEMARQLEAAGEQVAHLILIDNNPTEFAGVVPPDAVMRFKRHLHRKRIDRHSAELTDRGALRGLAYLIEGAGRKVGNVLSRAGIRTHLALGLPLPAILQDVVNTNRQALESYKPGKYSGHVTFITPEEDKEQFAPDPIDDWGQMAAGGYSVRYVRGAKGVLFKEPNVKELAATFIEVLRAPPTADPFIS